MHIWQSNDENGDRYEIRQAGYSLRLYRNAIFHSQFNNQRLENGGVWDLLWLPGFFLKSKKIKRVLLLGVGLGAALLKLKTLLPHAQFVAVDIDKTHLALAHALAQKQDLSQFAARIKNKTVGQLHLSRVNASSESNLTFECADAISWLQNYRGSKFDLIIDDLFVDGVDEQGSAQPSRVIELIETPESQGIPRIRLPQRHAWLAQLHKRLANSGLIIANCGSASDCQKAIKLWQSTAFEGYAWPTRSRMQPRGACIFSTEHYANRILVLGRDHLEHPISNCIGKNGSWQWSRQRLLRSVREAHAALPDPPFAAGDFPRLFASFRLRRYEIG